ncbi:MAG: hypothetical protein FWD66_03735 [Paludibacter sp.]|nr:hypothetical protein [Paludibacter sp.]
MKAIIKRPLSVFLIGALIVLIGAFVKIVWRGSTLVTILLCIGMLISAVGLILLIWYLIDKKKL